MELAEPEGRGNAWRMLYLEGNIIGEKPSKCSVDIGKVSLAVQQILLENGARVSDQIFMDIFVARMPFESLATKTEMFNVFPFTFRLGVC